MIDWVQVATLRDDVGAEDFDEVVLCFLEEVEDTIARLLNAPSVTTIEADMHFLKGSALSLGFQDFATQCAKGEELAQHDKTGDLDLNALTSCYEQSKQNFLRELDQKFVA